MEDELYHYGIRGMKWGVRRTPEQLGHAPKKKRVRANKVKKKDYKRATTRMAATTAELKKRRDRLKLEDEVRRLEWDNATNAEKMEKQATDTLIKYGGSAIAATVIIAGGHIATKYGYPLLAEKIGHLDSDATKSGANILAEILKKADKIAFPKK